MTTQQYNAYLAKRAAEKRAGSLDALEMPASKAVEEERELQRAGERWLNDNEIYFKHDNDSRKERPGIPDFLICYKGFVGAEAKSRTGKLSIDQRNEMARIRKSGGRTFVFRSLEELIYKLTEGINEERPR